MAESITGQVEALARLGRLGALLAGENLTVRPDGKIDAQAGGGGGGTVITTTGRAAPLPQVFVPSCRGWEAIGGVLDAGGEPAEDGEAARSWYSADGGAAWIQPTANKRSVWHANNGFPYIQFDGVNDDFGDLAVSAGGILIGVAFKTTQTGRSLISGYTGNNPYQPLLFIGFGGLLEAYDPVNALISAVRVDDGNLHRVILYSGPSGVGRRLWHNGALVAGAGSTSATTPAGLPMRLGAQPDGSSPFAGKVYNLQVADNVAAVPSDAAVAGLMNSLAINVL